MEIINFEEKHVSQAADVLAVQFARLLEKFPLLPDRITNPGIAKEFLLALLAKDESQGVVLLKGGRVRGYLLGLYGDNPFFGRHVIVPFGGMALEDQTALDELAALYCVAGKRWLKDGVLNHYLVMPALLDWLEAGFSLSFGKEQVYAVASVADLHLEPTLPDGIVMREVTPSDADGLYDCADWIAGHYNLAPVWEPVPAEYLAEIREGYAELAADPESSTWIALDGDRIVSFVMIHPEDAGPSNLFGVPELVHFSVAATDKEYRGRGIGRALLSHVMKIACAQGYETMTTDWRTTNPSAAHHWPGFGFEPYAYRLLRRVNPRYEKYIT